MRRRNQRGSLSILKGRSVRKRSGSETAGGGKGKEQFYAEGGATLLFHYWGGGGEKGRVREEFMFTIAEGGQNINIRETSGT